MNRESHHLFESPQQPETREKREQRDQKVKLRPELRLVKGGKSTAEEVEEYMETFQEALDRSLSIEPTVRRQTVRELNRDRLQQELRAIKDWQFWRSAEHDRLKQSFKALNREIVDEQLRIEEADELKARLVSLEKQQSETQARGEATNRINRDVQDIQQRIANLERGIHYVVPKQVKAVSNETARRAHSAEKLVLTDEDQLQSLESQLRNIPVWQFWRLQNREYLGIQIEALKNKIARDRTEKKKQMFEKKPQNELEALQAQFAEISKKAKETGPGAHRTELYDQLSNLMTEIDILKKNPK